MPAIEFFTVVANLSAVVVDYTDNNDLPDIQKISATVEFIPRIPNGALVWASGLTPPQGLALPRIRARFDTDGVLRTIVGAAVNEQQTITLPGSPIPYTLAFNGSAPTSTIAINATATTIDGLLEGLTTIGAGNVTVGGNPGGPYVVSFGNTLGNSDQPLLTATNGVTVTTTRPGTLGAGVKLVANTAVIDLDEIYYDVLLSNVVFGKADQIISPFAIMAPTVGNVTIDLAACEHFPPKPGLT